MPEENKPGGSPQDGSAYSPSQTFPRDLGPDGLPVREHKPQGRDEQPRGADEDSRAAQDVNLGRS
ncbi:hypothetical protein [Ramlibacter tataouinensis]|uniref:Uncharacterized protein n=1 Tax=Ramlibacter tataouinensis (strain ATCC BAA-407 / DSM 14655 / LMG 21543 / TTB310) TaxID=365046 RepID=F5XWN4_RAMTT|nr:hypothetical protein [Ramlibacter tataouinensis]AEG94178.1 hypothetical protein Rta_30680 [Ramlibacter tataouinensis TTB310]